MTEGDIKQQISALADGECEDAQAAIDHLLSDAAAREQWADIHLNRALLAGDLQRKASAGFAARLAVALEAEPVVLAPRNTAATPAQRKPQAAAVLRFFRPLMGVALAASVAALTVFSVDFLNSDTSQQTGAPALASAESATAPRVELARSQPAIVPVAFTGAYDAEDRTYWQGSDESMQDELNRYLANHSEYANPGGYQSMVPYVRLAGYDSHQ